MYNTIKYYICGGDILKFSYKELIKSVLLGILVAFASLYTLGFLFPSSDGLVLVIGTAILSSIFYCTSLMLEYLKSIEKTVKDMEKMQIKLKRRVEKNIEICSKEEEI